MEMKQQAHAVFQEATSECQLCNHNTTECAITELVAVPGGAIQGGLCHSTTHLFRRYFRESFACRRGGGGGLF